METPPSYYGRAPVDRGHIVIDDPLELRWWCGRFGCSDLRLIGAVSQVGSAPSQVEQYLRFSASFDARSLSKPGSERSGKKAHRRNSVAAEAPELEHAGPIEADMADTPAAAPVAAPVPDDRH